MTLQVVTMLGLSSCSAFHCCLLILNLNIGVALCEDIGSTETALMRPSRLNDNATATEGAVEDNEGGHTSGFLTGFLSSLEVTILSELGDNSFFISLVLAMKHSRVVVFFGAMSAFFFSIIFTALIGLASTLIPRIYTHYFSIVIFTAFGIKMLYEGCSMKNGTDVDEQIDEAKDQIDEENGEQEDKNSATNPGKSVDNLECGVDSADRTIDPEPSEVINDDGNEVTEKLNTTSGNTLSHKTIMKRATFCCSNECVHVYFQALAMTFVGEMGDRSQVATMVIAATGNIWGTCVGGLLGHAICCGIAVIGGRLLAKKISVKTVTIIGGIMFLGFAIVSLIFMKPSE